MKLDAVVDAIADQVPVGEDVEQYRRRKMFERSGSGTLKFAAILGVAAIIFFYTQYEALGYFFGPALFGAIVVLVWLVMVGLGIRSVPTMFMKGSNPAPQVDAPTPTGIGSRLIEDRPFEPVPSVTENTTEHLKVPRQKDD